MDDIRTRLIGRSIYWSDKEDMVLAWEAARAITDLWLEIERLRAMERYAEHRDNCQQPYTASQLVCNCGLSDLQEARRV